MTTIKTRNNDVDIIRMVALVGICVVNVPYMALPEAVVMAPSKAEFWDWAWSFFLMSFAGLKFFLLFSFIFGWGMAIQQKSAAAKNQNFARRYFGRMTGLAVLGVAHAILVFNGDILLLYALLGCFLWMIKDHSPRALMKIAGWMVPVSMCCLILMGGLFWFYEDTASTLLEAAGYGGHYLEATQQRFLNWPEIFIFLLFMQGPLVFGAFAAGLAAAKSDFFCADSYGFNFLAEKWPLLVAIALPLNLLFAAAILDMFAESYEILTLLGFILIPIAAPALSVVYLYCLVRFARTVQLPTLLVLAGRNSLSTYVLQGILGGMVFGAYGFGLFNSIGHAGLVPLSLVIAFSAMLCVGVYASIFGHGPLEPVLRRFSR